MAKDRHGHEVKVGDYVSFPWRIKEIFEVEDASFLVLEPGERGGGNQHTFSVVSSGVHKVHAPPAPGEITTTDEETEKE